MKILNLQHGFPLDGIRVLRCSDPEPRHGRSLLQWAAFTANRSREFNSGICHLLPSGSQVGAAEGGHAGQHVQVGELQREASVSLCVRVKDTVGALQDERQSQQVCKRSFVRLRQFHLSKFHLEKSAKVLITQSLDPTSF